MSYSLYFKKVIFLLFILLFISGSKHSFGQEAYVYKQPRQLNDGWKTDDLRNRNADLSVVTSFFNQMKTEAHLVHSILLVKDDLLLVEEYFNNYQWSSKQDLRSVTKSIRSILLGIAIDKGFIDNVNDPVLKYITDKKPLKNLDQRKETISIKDLLTMSSGLDCDDWNKNSKGQEDRIYKKQDWIQETLDLPMINKPGEVSTYCSMGAILVAEAISQASGMSLDQFALKYLFKPMGISNVSWGHTSKKEIIDSGKRAYMTPRDMAKIGQLMLHEGNWKGNQIVSAEWIQEVLMDHTKIAGLDYGYFWWSIPFQSNGKIIESSTATGNGGQYIMVIRELKLVAVFTGGAYNLEADKLPFAVMSKVVLPLVLQN